MGNFYVNFTVCGSEQQAVANWLWAANRKAIVGATIDGKTVFYEDEADSQDSGVIQELAMKASEDLEVPVLAVLNHDDDVFCYWLAEGGEIVDQYNSWPEYFDGGEREPRGGDAKKLCDAFGVAAKVTEMEKLLRSVNDTFAMELHMALVKLLKCSDSYAMMGYRYLEEGEFPEGVSEKDLVRVG